MTTRLQIDQNADNRGTWVELKFDGLQYFHGLKHLGLQHSTARDLTTISWPGIFARKADCVEFFENSAQTFLRHTGLTAISRYLSASGDQLFVDAQNYSLHRPQIIEDAQALRLELYIFRDTFISESLIRSIGNGQAGREPDLCVWADVHSEGVAPPPQVRCGIFGNLRDVYDLRKMWALHVEKTHISPLPAQQNVFLLEVLFNVVFGI